MYDPPARRAALEQLAAGGNLSETARATGIHRSTLRAWTAADHAVALECFRCHRLHPANAACYSALLGYYLGDGCVSTFRSRTTLRISCDAALPGVVDDVTRLVGALRLSGGVFHVRAPGVLVVSSNWKHWTCLFPQHGPGRKHDRPIVLEDWQRDVVTAHPADFLRGLFHSDGCRAHNWATRMVRGEKRRYEYPRWQFRAPDRAGEGLGGEEIEEGRHRPERSDELCEPSRNPCAAAVAWLDELIGPKS